MPGALLHATTLLRDEAMPALDYATQWATDGMSKNISAGRAPDYTSSDGGGRHGRDHRDGRGTHLQRGSHRERLAQAGAYRELWGEEVAQAP